MNNQTTCTARFRFLCFAVASLGVVLDQLAKLLTERLMQLGQSVPLIPEVLHLTYVQNRGAAFGMLENARWLFLIPSLLIIPLACAYLVRGRAGGRLAFLGIALILSGGVGNMIDRLALGYVVDTIDFTLINFAVFNVADSLVCVGAGLLMLALILDEVKDSRRRRQTADSEGGTPCA